MKLELKNIKYAAFNSEETSCYQAKVYVDGKPMIEVSNDGHGGSDNQWPIKPFTDKDIEKVNSWCINNLPKWISEYSPGKKFDTDLEIWCGEALGNYLTSRDLKNLMRRKILYLEGNAIYESSFKKFKTVTQDLLVKYINTYPDREILNTMAFSKALKLFKQFA
jgi:hypothetical protein